MATGWRIDENFVAIASSTGSDAIATSASLAFSANSTTDTPTIITKFAPAIGMNTTSICTCLASVLTRAISSPIWARSW